MFSPALHFDAYCTIEWRCWHSQTQVPPSESFQVPLLPKHLPVVRKENNLSMFSDQNRRSKNYPKTLCLFKLLRKKNTQLVETILNCWKTPESWKFHLSRELPQKTHQNSPSFWGPKNPPHMYGKWNSIRQAVPQRNCAKEPADHKALHQNLGEEAPREIPSCSHSVPVWVGEIWWNWIFFEFFFAKPKFIRNFVGLLFDVCLVLKSVLLFGCVCLEWDS